VLKKRSDDQGGQLAALIAYYAFFSIFPLLLVFVTGLGFVLSGDANLREQIVNSALGQIPVLGNQIHKNVGSLHGSTVALIIGIAGSLFGGLGVTLATESAFNRVWGVPFKSRPDFLTSRLRGLLLLLVLGSATIAATVLAGALAGGTKQTGTVGQIAGFVVTLVVNFGVFIAAFRFLTARSITFQALLPGAVLAALLWEGVQTLGGVYVNHVLRHADETYGLFGVVIGLLSFLYLGAQIVVISAEINVVREHELWPRSLFSPPLTSGDERALRALARTEERVHQQTVEVSFREEDRS
jgi:membrane protein